MTVHRLNYFTWFAKRLVDHCPPHFVRTDFPATKESILWVYEHLNGRFAIIKKESEFLLFDMDTFLAFEEPDEAVIYNLKWS